MATDDLKSHATSTTADYYDLLSLPSHTTDQEAIRRAYRKTALKYHPDKVGASNHAALEKFHLLQIAYDVLSDPDLKDIYDNARRAREQVKEREQLLSARRSDMKADLERREREGVGAGTGKRKWGEEDAWARELAGMREDTKRRRVELEERRRREMDVLVREEEAGGANQVSGGQVTSGDGVEDMERSVKVRFKASEGAESHKDELMKAFERFGPVQDVVIRSRPPKDSSGKKKRQTQSALVVFKSVVGAHAAVSDLGKLMETDPNTYGRYEKIEWATGREPAFVPESKPSVVAETRNEDVALKDPVRQAGDASPHGEVAQSKNGSSTPKFSFKGTSSGGASLDEITMMRLKNAEKKRLEAKIRREEAAADAEQAPS